MSLNHKRVKIGAGFLTVLVAALFVLGMMGSFDSIMMSIEDESISLVRISAQNTTLTAKPAATINKSALNAVSASKSGAKVLADEFIRDSLKQFAEDKIYNLNIESSVFQNPSKALSVLPDFVGHPDSEVRYIAAKLVSLAASSSDSKEDRQQAILLLLDMLVDKEILVSQHVSNALLNFTAADFSPQAQAALREIFKITPTPEIILIIGIAGVNIETEHLDELLDVAREQSLKGKPARYASIDWAVRKARARQGSVDDQRIIETEVAGQKDDVLRVTKLLGDLAYIRSEEATEVLVTYLNSDDRLPKHSNYLPGTPYNQYALYFLASMFSKFPVTARQPGGFTEEQLETAKGWMDDKKNWVPHL